MTDATSQGGSRPSGPSTRLTAADSRTKKRNASEKRFRAYGLAAIGTGLFFLVVLLTSIISNGSTAFMQTFIEVPVYLDPEALDPFKHLFFLPIASAYVQGWWFAQRHTVLSGTWRM